MGIIVSQRRENPQQMQRSPGFSGPMLPITAFLTGNLSVIRHLRRGVSS
jgi:hypothetical protein